jgi:hypothetical protein
MNRNALTAATVVVVCLFLLGAAPPGGSESGRWQIVLIPSSGDSLVLLLDTATGETRSLIRESGQPPHWGVPLRMDRDGPSREERLKRAMERLSQPMVLPASPSDRPAQSEP